MPSRSEALTKLSALSPSPPDFIFILPSFTHNSITSQPLPSSPILSPHPAMSQPSATRPLSLKERIHRFKIPLSPQGLRIARVAYFTIPIVAGLLVMQGTNAYEVRHRPEWIAEADAVAEAHAHSAAARSAEGHRP